MNGRRVANIVKRFVRHRDDMWLANFQRVRGLDADPSQNAGMSVVSSDSVELP